MIVDDDGPETNSPLVPRCTAGQSVRAGYARLLRPVRTLGTDGPPLGTPWLGIARRFHPGPLGRLLRRFVVWSKCGTSGRTSGTTGTALQIPPRAHTPGVRRQRAVGLGPVPTIVVPRRMLRGELGVHVQQRRLSAVTDRLVRCRKSGTRHGAFQAATPVHPTHTDHASVAVGSSQRQRAANKQAGDLCPT